MLKTIILLGLMLSAQAQTLDLVSPLETYEESSTFGLRRDVMGGAHYTFHGGRDDTALAGTRVRAAAEGVVRETWLFGWHGGVWYSGHPIFGAMVLIEHHDGSFTRYGHLSEISVREGERVLAGQTIGIIGTSGVSTGTHLHFEHLQAPVIPPSVEPEDPERGRWRRILTGCILAEQEADGER